VVKKEGIEGEQDKRGRIVVKVEAHDVFRPITTA